MIPFNLEQVRDNAPFEILTKQGWKLGKLLHVAVLPSGDKQLKIGVNDLDEMDVKYIILPSEELRMVET